MSYYYEHLYGPNKNEAYINILAPTCKLFNLLYHGNVLFFFFFFFTNEAKFNVNIFCICFVNAISEIKIK
jgi:hypothetical protein